jgi:hypothetical protein
MTTNAIEASFGEQGENLCEIGCQQQNEGN